MVCHVRQGLATVPGCLLPRLLRLVMLRLRKLRQAQVYCTVGAGVLVGVAADFSKVSKIFARPHFPTLLNRAITIADYALGCAWRLSDLVVSS